ncbi:MAG: polyprenyl synthetase family protein, partial [Aquifex sp.]
ERVKLWKEKVEKRLLEILKPEGPKELIEAMKYYPMQKGKRIRPLFTVAVANSLGGDEDDAITVGCGIELIHNYSLVHDDLPCMDNDSIRRGLPTCHVKFGEAMALLAGDALLTYTFEVLSDKENYKTLSCEEILEINRIVAKKAGSNGMVGGQVLDIKGYEDLYEVSVKKTGALFEACFMCGAVVAKRKDLLSDMERIGRKVGLLFQMVDDYLDKDGFYIKFGENLKEEVKKLYEELKEEDIFKRSEALKYLLDLIYKRIT